MVKLSDEGWRSWDAGHSSSVFSALSCISRFDGRTVCKTARYDKQSEFLHLVQVTDEVPDWLKILPVNKIKPAHSVQPFLYNLYANGQKFKFSDLRLWETPTQIGDNVTSPLPSTRQHPSYSDCLEVKREYYQNCSVLGCVTQCSQSSAHSYEQFLPVQQIGFVTLGPLRHA